MSGFVCYNCGWWTDVNGVAICGYSGRTTVRHDSCEAWKTKVKTNGDRIRQMSDVELADLLTAVAKKSAEMLCKSLETVEVDLSKCDFEILTKSHLSWLKSPVEVGNG